MSGGLFQHTKDVYNVESNKALMRGVMDFSNLAQWDMFETGYAFLKIIKIPAFLEKLNDRPEYKELIDTYKRILEFEFKSVNGLPNIDSETLQITNGMSTIELIGKTNYESNVTFSMPYYERSGAPLTKVHELFLRGIKDPKTGFKHYNGLISQGMKASYENETFTFLFGFTDNTGLNLERAYMMLGVQPTSAPLSELYEYTKGTIENKELSLEFRGYCVTGIEVDACGKEVLRYLNSSSKLAPEDGYMIKNESTVHYKNLVSDVNKSGSVVTQVKASSVDTY